jgi:hypothetical protein
MLFKEDCKEWIYFNKIFLFFNGCEIIVGGGTDWIICGWINIC